MATQDASTGMTEVDAAEFKEHCLELIEDMADSGRGMILSRDGKPYAVLSAFRTSPHFGADRGKIEIIGDIESPIDVVWEAEQGLIDGQ